jgi:hypothetical protein
MAKRSADYDEGWRKLRLLRLYVILVWVSFLPFALLVFKVMDHFPQFHALGLVLLIPMVAFWIFGYRMNNFQCPRCGKRFDPLGTFNGWGNGWGKRCAHCGLAKWSQG